MRYENLRDKVVVITGASSGFGKGAALKFAQEGASVVLAARRAGLLTELAQECESKAVKALPVETDVSREEDLEKLKDAALSTFGQIDVWVNNAGVGALGRFEEVPLADHVKVIETDLLGTLYGSYFAMAQFRKQGFGTLINVSSVLGKVPSPYYASYAAAKHGVVGLSGSLRQELAADKVEDIHVCTVLPTSFDTPFFDHASNYTGHESAPIPPVYEPEKVVDVIVGLAKDPDDEVSVGTAAKVSIFAHQVAPHATERKMRKEAYKAQIEEAPLAADTPGSVLRPSRVGTTVKRKKA
jgi:short-subunit dehydrogenase